MKRKSKLFKKGWREHRNAPDKNKAKKLAERLRAKGYQAVVKKGSKTKSGKRCWRVLARKQKRKKSRR